MNNVSLWFVFDESKERLEATKKHLVGLGPITTHSLSTKASLKDFIERLVKSAKDSAGPEKGLIINLDGGFDDILPLVRQYRELYPAIPILVAVS